MRSGAVVLGSRVVRFSDKLYRALGAPGSRRHPTPRSSASPLWLAVGGGFFLPGPGRLPHGRGRRTRDQASVCGAARQRRISAGLRGSRSARCRSSLRRSGYIRPSTRAGDALLGGQPGGRTSTRPPCAGSSSRSSFVALRIEQAVDLFAALLESCAGNPLDSEALRMVRAELHRSSIVTPGDFAAVQRRMRALRLEPSPSDLVRELQWEAASKRGRSRTAGFAHG